VGGGVGGGGGRVVGGGGRCHGGQVDEVSIAAVQPAEGRRARQGSAEDGGQLVLGEGLPVVAPVELHVAPRQVREWVVGGPFLPDHPGHERLEGIEVEVAGLDAAAPRAQGGE